MIFFILYPVFLFLPPIPASSQNFQPLAGPSQRDYFAANWPDQKADSPVLFVGYSFSDNWQQEMRAFPKKGGFFATRAIQKIYYEMSESTAPLDPRIVVVGTDDNYSITAKDMQDWDLLLPYLRKRLKLTVQGNLQCACH